MPIVTGLGRSKNIALLPAGRSDDDKGVDKEYQKLLHGFNWGTFYYEPYYGRSFLEKVVEFLGEQGFEHLLVDARTGDYRRAICHDHTPPRFGLFSCRTLPSSPFAGLTNRFSKSRRLTRNAVERRDPITGA